MLSTALSFFGGGIAGKVAVASIAAGVVGMSVLSFSLWWVYDDLGDAKSANGKLRGSIGQRDEAIKKLNTSIVGYKKFISDKDIIHAAELGLVRETYKRREEIAEAARGRASVIEEIIDENPAVKSWADTALPVDILKCLQQPSRDLCASARSAASGENFRDAAGGLNGELSSP